MADIEYASTSERIVKTADFYSSNLGLNKRTVVDVALAFKLQGGRILDPKGVQRGDGIVAW